MRFIDLTVKNFLSIQEAFLTFSPGVHLLEGVNFDMAADEGESNGAGKSSVFEALQFALYGTLSRGKTKEDDVVNRAAGKDCLVTVRFEHAGKQYVVTRTRLHSEYGNSVSWSVDGKDMTQHRVGDTEKNLEDELPISFDVFKHSIQVGQGFPDRFLSLSETEKQDLLCKMVDLTIYDRALELSKGKISESETQISLLSGSIELLKSQIIRWEGELSSYKAALEAYKLQKAPDVAQVEAENVAIEAKLLSLREQAAIIKQNQEAEAKLYETAVAEERALSVRLQTLYQEISKLQSSMESLRKEKDRITSTPTHCPTCKRPVERANVQGRIDEISKETELLHSSLAEKSVPYKQMHDTYQILHAQSEGLRKSCSQVAEKTRAIMDSESDLRKRKELLSSGLQEYGRQVAQFTDRVLHTEATIAKLQEELPPKERAIEDHKKSLEHWKFWKTIIPNLRSAAVSEVLSYLNQRVDKYLSYFSSGAMGMSFFQEVYGKGSKIKVDLRTPGGTYVMSSGGERRRVDLAVYLALSDLLQASSGIKCNLMVADEIADGLSPAGVKKFLFLLREKAEAEGQTIFVISHNPTVKEVFCFDSILTMERRAGKATLQIAA